MNTPASCMSAVMRRAGKWVSAATLALLLASTTHAAGTSREVPYKELVRIPLMMEKVDDDHVFSGEFSVASADAKQPLPADLRVEVLVKDEAVAVQVDPDGHLQLPVRQDWVDAGAKLRINQPKGRLVLGYNFRARPPSGTRMRYAKLAESAAIMERGIKAEAGWLSFAAPSPYALDIRFKPGPAQVLEIRFADGTSKRWTAAVKGDGSYNGIELPWKPEWRDADVILSEPLGGVMPLVK